MNGTSVALIAAGIGAGGAIAGQIVGAVVTARRERKRLDWDQTQARRAEQLDVTRRFLDVKRETCAAFLNVARSSADAILRVEISPPEGIAAAAQEMRASSRRRHESMRQLMFEISLLAPDVGDAADAVIDYVESWEMHAGGEMYGAGSTLEGFTDVLDECARSMRKSMGLESI